MNTSTNFTIHSNAIKKQAGMSLVEVLVSMVVGMFLLTGVITSLIATKDNDKMRNTISEMDANARTAFELLRNTIMHAGYPSIHSKVIDKPFLSPADLPIKNIPCRGDTMLENRPPKWDRSSRDDDSDVLTSIYLADNPCLTGDACTNRPANFNPRALIYFDCTGGGATRNQRAVSCSADPVNGIAPPAQPADAKIYSTFRVTQNRMLSCHGSRGGSQSFIENAESIQFLYGVQRDDGSVNYKNASDVEDADEWEGVVSVQVGLLLRSSNQYLLKKTSDVTAYDVLDESVDVGKRDLRRLFRVYTTTIYLANKNRGRMINGVN